MRTTQKRPVISLPLLLILLAGITSPPARGQRASRLHVEVKEAGNETPKVSLSLSMDVLSALAASFIDEGEICTSILDHLGDQGIDLQAFWQSVRAGGGGELLNLDADQTHIRAFRQDGLLHLTVQEEEGQDHVQVSIPEDLLDFLLGADEGTTLADLVEQLENYAGMTLVAVESDRETVRIWLD
ncbi:MAG: hypothetical protein ACE5ID_11205 [Acidobacteriota bacterium]